MGQVYSYTLIPTPAFGDHNGHHHGLLESKNLIVKKQQKRNKVSSILASARSFLLSNSSSSPSNRENSKKCPDYRTNKGLIKNPIVVNSKLSRDEEEKEKEILSRGMSNSFSCYNLHRETIVSSESHEENLRNNCYRPDSSYQQHSSSILDSTSTNQSHSDESSFFRRSSIGEDEEAPFIDEDVDEDENGELVSPTSLNCKMSHLDLHSQINRNVGLMGLNGQKHLIHGGKNQLTVNGNTIFHRTDLMRKGSKDEHETFNNNSSSSGSSASSSIAATSSLINDWRVKRRIQPEPPTVAPPPIPIPRIQLTSPTNCTRTSVKCYQGQMQEPQKPMVFLTSSNKERNASNPMYQETRNGKLVNANGSINRNKTVIQASTSELLRALGDYVETVVVSLRNPSMEFNTHDLAFWLRSVDRSLLIQGWQEIAFVNPANLVFLFLLLREMIQELIRRRKLNKISDLQSLTLTCLYISYGYMGNEISYPLKPFLCDTDCREDFFDRALFIINRMSGKMLQINSDPAFFTSTFSDLLLGSHQQQQPIQPHHKLSNGSSNSNSNSKPVPFVRTDSIRTKTNVKHNSNGLSHDIENANIIPTTTSVRNSNHFSNRYNNPILSKPIMSNFSLTSASTINSSNLNNNNNCNPLINIR